MSGDVQPRKRKDKKRKRDSLDRRSDGEIIFSRKSSLQSEEEEIIHHGVHATKMGTEDVHLHVQSEHGTGGNWCAKIFFFSLMAILIGLVGLIIMENRGLSDLDTPLQESRFSEYFEGWVDEHREETHDDHLIVAHEIEEHDLHDEPFEEIEENVSQGVDDDDDDDDEVNDDDAVDHDNDHEDEDNKMDENNETAEDDHDDTNEDNETAEDDDNDDDDNDNKSDEDNIEPSLIKTKRETQLKKELESSKNQEEQDDDNDDNNDIDDDIKIKNNNKNDNSDANNKDNDDPFDEEEYDGTFESLEEYIVDNDAEEINLLQKKADQASQNNAADSEENTSTPIAVKIIVGLALALVARLVLIKKRPENVTSELSIDEKILIEQFQSNEQINQSKNLFKNEENEPPVAGDFCANEDDEIYSDNEEYEEEIEEIEEEEEDNNITESEYIRKTKLNERAEKYVPETFEQLNAMFRHHENIPLVDRNPKLQVDVKLQTTKTIEFKPRFDRNEKADIFDSLTHNIENMTSQSSNVEVFSPKLPIPSQQIDKSIEEKFIAAKYAASTAQPEVLIESDEDGEDENDILDDEEIYEEEIEEEEDGEELSDNNGDDELMKRLEEKYGKLPVNFDTDEEEEEEENEDSSWTRIKPRSGGAQTLDESDFIEAELNRAEEEMTQNNTRAGLKIYESLALKYPDSPAVLYGKANALNNIATNTGSIDILKSSIAACLRYLAFEELVADEDFTKLAYLCIDQMKTINLFHPAVHIHLQLIKRFDHDPKSRNELAETYLNLNRFKDAEDIIEENLKRWPNNGTSLAYYGYIHHFYNKLENAAYYLQLGIETGEERTQRNIFYSTLGQTLLILNRTQKAREIFRKGVTKKLFPTEYQRPLAFIKDLRAQPIWSKEETTYSNILNLLESNWRQIRDEGISVLNEKGYFKNEKENLTNSGLWQEFSLIANGEKNVENCKRAQFTCALIEIFAAARHCTHGQVKFSVIHPGTHIKPHCGPHNARLRAHLGLKVPNGPKIRIVQDERSWEDGKLLIFDDSFEHEVWHNGNGIRLVLIVDFWHPQVKDEHKEFIKKKFGD